MKEAADKLNRKSFQSPPSCLRHLEQVSVIPELRKMFQVLPNTQNLSQPATKPTFIHAPKNMQSPILARFSAARNRKLIAHQITISPGRVTNTQFQVHKTPELTLNLIIQIQGIQMLIHNLKRRELITHHQSRAIIFQHQVVQTIP